ncbi:hypothetical protein C0J52_14335 [Blattella germanica]|nr:hypothetical protein C0J52_14335 [Blattella germanica]
MKPFKGAYAEACALWMRRNPKSRITDYKVAALVNSAYTRLCRLDIALKGFSSTGIHPMNPNIFTDLDFASSFLTESEKNHEEITPASASDIATQCTDTNLVLSASATIGFQNFPSPVSNLLAPQMRNAETQPSTSKSGVIEHHTPQIRNEEPQPSTSRSEFSECRTPMKQRISPSSTIDFELAMKKLSPVLDKERVFIIRVYWKPDKSS